MAKPKYMRFFPDAYLEDTFTLNMEEQGIYMRLLCLMWTHGGKIPSNDKMIARLLGIHSNKWRKVKPQLMPFLSEIPPDFLTQKRLRSEYKHSVDKLEGTIEQALNTPLDTPHDTYGVTMGVTHPDTHGVTPLVHGVEIEENQMDNFKKCEKSEFAFLDLEESSRSINKIKNKTRLDGGEQNCGKLSAEAIADVFLDDVREVFRTHNAEMPSDHQILCGWIDDGIHPFRHILPSVKKVLARLSGGACDPPKSWKYFAKEVYRQQKIGEQYGKAKK